ncbi:MAG: hypothetical protein SGARI_001898 [Bacillariaceae sp.]
MGSSGVDNASTSGEAAPALRPNRRSATSLTELLNQIEHSGEMSVEQQASDSRPELTAASLQALLNQVEDNGVPTSPVSVVDEPTAPIGPPSRSSSAASLQRLLQSAEGDVSPSVVPPSGVYSTTPVSFIRSSVPNASLRELFNETDGNGNPVMRPPLVNDGFGGMMDTIEPDEIVEPPLFFTK